MITQIIVSVGTLSIILQEVRAAAYTCPPRFPCPNVHVKPWTEQASWLHSERSKMVERLKLMMRKSDPLLLQQLHQSYTEAAQAFSLEEGKQQRRNSSRHKSMSRIKGLDTMALPEQSDGLGKTEFVVSMLVSLGCIEWADAIPVMKHFDALDQRGAGKLYAEDLELIAAREEANKKLASTRRLLADKMRASGIKDKKAQAQQHHVAAARKYEESGDYSAAARELEQTGARPLSHAS